MKPILAVLFLTCFYFSSRAQQYTVNGNAFRESCNCYKLTDNVGNQSGSVWNNNRIDLSNSFDFNFDVYLGNNDGGADGIAFVLQPISTSVGSLGGGMGLSGISPSIGVTLDTYQNSSPDNDPFYDHIAIQRNGDLNHASTNNLAGPLQASASSADIEDGVTHKLRVVWDAATKTFTTYFDGIQRLSIVNDFVATTFGGNPMVFWGFTGATGGLSNLQRFCTALSPGWNFLPTQKRCLGEPIQFVNSTISFATIIKMYWNFGDGSNIDSVNASPTHTYTSAGNYVVTQRVIGADGCEQTNTQNVIIGSKPIAAFTVNDSCVNNSIQFTATAFVSVGSINNWYWELDAGISTTVQNPAFTYNTPGIKNIRMAVKSLQGCESDTISRPLRIYGRPVMDFTYTDSLCLGSTYVFNGTGVSPDGMPVVSWGWLIDGTIPGNNSATLSHVFTTPGNHTIRLLGSTTGASGCLSTPVQKNVFVVDKPRAAIKVFRGCEDLPVTLQDSSYTLDGLPVTAWWWDLGNGNFSTLQNPNTIYANAGPINIQLVVWNSKGCKSDTLRTTINIFGKPEVDFTITDSCVGNTIQFNGFTSTGSGNAASWYWYLDNAGATSTLQNPTSVYLTPGIKNIKLAAVNSNGCVSDTLFRPVKIYDKPVISFSFQDSVCLGTAINFSGAVQSSADPVAGWQWTIDGVVNTATTQNLSHTFTTAGNHTVSVSATTTGVASCYGPVVQKNVFIAGKPVAAIKSFKACRSVATQLQDSSYALDGVPVTSWWWDLGNGNFSTQQNPTVTYNASGIYNIQLVAGNSRGCKSDTLKTTIKVYTAPVAEFTFSDPSCFNNSIRFTDASVSDTSMVAWSWSTGAAVFSTAQNPSQPFAAGMNHTVSLVATNAAGCISAPVAHSFLMKTKPAATMAFNNACKNDEVIFSATETSTIGIVEWHWNVGAGSGWAQGNPLTHTYTANGNFPVKMYGISTEGCPTDTIAGTITIYGTDAFAGNDVIAAADQPIQLNATGGLSYQWTPSTGLSAANIANPVAINNVDRTYYLRAFTPEGCESFDTINIKIYKGPEIYVPTGFTPNGDGRNDILKPIAVGITVFEYFAVYNRYGQLVFKSSNPNAGWDGRVKGMEQQTGNFVWMVSGTDFRGNKIFRKGSVLLIK